MRSLSVMGGIHRPVKSRAVRQSNFAARFMYSWATNGFGGLNVPRSHIAGGPEQKSEQPSPLLQRYVPPSCASTRMSGSNDFANS